MIRIWHGFFAKKWPVISTKFKRWHWPITLPTIDKQRSFPQIDAEDAKMVDPSFALPVCDAGANPACYRSARQARSPLFELADEIRALYRRRRKSARAPWRRARLVGGRDRQTYPRSERVRPTLPEDRSERLAHPAAG